MYKRMINCEFVKNEKVEKVEILNIQTNKYKYNILKFIGRLNRCLYNFTFLIPSNKFDILESYKTLKRTF